MANVWLGLLFLAMPLQAGAPLELWIDGSPVAHLSGPVTYDAGSGRVSVQTFEQIRCAADRVHADRFEAN